MAIKSNHISTEICTLSEYETCGLFLQALGYSKNQTKKYISKKLLNKKVNKGEVIRVPLPFLNRNLINPVYSGQEITIIYEDDDCIVVDKPEGINGHPLSYEESNTIVNFIRSCRSCETLYMVQENERGLLYRLDFVTSGVLIYCKSFKMYKKLRENFNELMKVKEYYAIVCGNFNKEGSHTNFLKGSGVRGSKVVSDSSGVEVSASFKKLNYDKKRNYSLVKVSLKTGFRHQIRAQLSLLEFPILGDELYGGQEAKRVYLHAFKYSFHYQDKLYDLRSEPCGLFKDLLNLNS